MFDSLFEIKLTKIGSTIEIINFNTRELINFIEKKYNTSRITNHMFIKIGRIIKLHEFFLLEFFYILNEAYTTTNRKYRYRGNKSRLLKLIEIIKRDTWINDIKEQDTKIPTTLDLSKIKEFNLTLKDYQLEFIKDIYTQKKDQYHLNGYLLSFDLGLGKTITSLVLMRCLKKDVVIVLCPKTVIDNAWVGDITKFDNTKKSIYVSTMTTKIKPGYDYYIFNYESANKLLEIADWFKTKNVGIVIDESHNFKDYKSVRSNILYELKTVSNCKDVLLVSGTPLKALGIEMMTILKILDPYFIPEVEERFKHVFGLSKAVATEILAHRLGTLMFRRLKADVGINLPEKHIIDIFIETPNGEDYTLSNVRVAIEKFSEERRIYYDKNYDTYHNKFLKALEYFEFNYINPSNIGAYKNYLKDIETLRKSNSYIDPVIRGIILNANVYERTNIIPVLPLEFKKDFLISKSVVKYVKLKILGEVIGGLLNRLRSTMFQEMIVHSPLMKIINDAEKKTVCFTTYVDVALSCNEYLIKNKFKPLLVTGETTKNITSIMNTFKTDIKINPLIATIQTLSTGVTLVEANTIIFLNNPWRSVDRDQASARVHRIGQDTDVYINNFILKTKEPDNLSTRMEDILNWSKEMFDAIVDGVSIIKNDFIDFKNDQSSIVEYNKVNSLIDNEITYIQNLLTKG